MIYGGTTTTNTSGNYYLVLNEYVQTAKAALKIWWAKVCAERSDSDSIK